MTRVHIRRPGVLSSLSASLPRLGYAGSRSALLHIDPGADDQPRSGRLGVRELNRFQVLRWIGTIGALLIGLGALGAGALPVVGNPYSSFPGGTFMSRMLQTSSIMVLVGVGLLVLAWVCMGPFVGAPYRGTAPGQATVTSSLIKRTFAAWVLPILFTAPLFTQDIYSYLAQGAIVARGMDPYAAGPVDLLGPEDPLARSVPFIWSHSPSPYGPVALGLASVISRVTADSIIMGVIGHRLISLLGLIAAGWAISRLARRCRVNPVTALWLGMLNPLTILHLIGGIHNESILLGLMLVGMELGLRGVDKLGGRNGQPVDTSAGAGLVVASAVLIACAGMVKVTGFLALGFVGMNLARHLVRVGRGPVSAIATAIAVQVVLLVATIAAVTAATGIGLGWVTGQGGAASIRSWLSMTTDIGVVTGFIGMLLGLGDHTDAMLSVTRTVGVLIAAGFLVRMLFATFRGTIHPVGGLGVATFVLVILFPVVHPWYMLWAIVPLAAWANRFLFRVAVVAYSTFFSFTVLPRGLSLPPATVGTIYLGSTLALSVVIALGWWLMRRRAARGLH
ncbi:polyprenol phosphomannose-dependent alpha 1,6 mannosyltransferase MptB [Corynebacterium sp. YIM 101645]|uniref:Polyprenol phosphomannose-dependent alpha 1,6 mannosyltransferase MptB n=1 Tax=Corynebacterium lemuris TaxID=1859292 RepID=A0ABT2FX00_9CORY|nr:polyprenol phosphomannose-dependent alpha 1,6 mannosyltransferase MptB [Corynebacterium lemuris]MCS5479529.1 polyprenol phosphomannose-dependent alpha 1,6 mannosyltransferase MptB [Corynebacterium lemuris]